MPQPHVEPSVCQPLHLHNGLMPIRSEKFSSQFVLFAATLAFFLLFKVIGRSVYV